MMAGYGRLGIPRNVNIWTALRILNRNQKVGKPKQVNHTSALPPATQYAGRQIWVAGSVKALYVSDGSNWKKVTVT